MSRAWGLAVLSLAASAWLAGCTDDVPAADLSASSSQAPPTPLATDGQSASTTDAPPLESEVKAAYLDLSVAYTNCLRAPSQCDPAALTASVGQARGALSKTLADLVSGGLFVGDEDAGYVVVESVALTGPTSAVVTSCWWDTGVLYGPPASVGGAPIVVNNLEVTARFETTMVLEERRWLTSEETRTDRVEGENRCPPEG